MKRCLLFLVLLSFFTTFAAQNSPYTVSGGNGAPYLADNNIQYRIEIYLLNGLSGAKISFTSSDGGAHQWYQYSENANNATPISSIREGNSSFITDIQEGYGYFVGSPTDPLTRYVWIIDYSKYIPRFFSLTTEEESDKCSFLKIIADMEAEPLLYFLPNGFQRGLAERFYNLKYNSQEWDGKEKRYVVKEENIRWQGLENPVPAPLINTNFILSGDQYAEKLGLLQSIVSDEYRAIAVDAHCIAETNKIHADNEIHFAGDVLGGSAPIEYVFSAFANEPVAASYKWKISQQDSITGKWDLIAFYPNNKNLRYVFERDGIFRVELEVMSSGKSVCVDTTKFFDVIINSTMIKIPNAFSPGSSFGVNDELKISFSSIVSFKATIVNRWGNVLFQWSDPTKGWDGRVNGKFVPTGVYFVIVEYKDSLGKSRTMSKAVNILRANNSYRNNEEK